LTIHDAPDWSRVQTVCLDMDGTVLDLRFDNFFWLEEVPRRYAVRHGLDPQSALARLHTELDAVRGTLAWYCIDHWSERLALDVMELKREHRARIRCLPGALEFVAAVRGLGKRVLLTTNAHPATLAVKDEQVGLGPHFDALISAHDIGAPKESGEFWPRLCAQVALDPGTTLFVDDSAPVLEAARRARVRWIYQVLQPDSTLPPREPRPDVAGIRALAELLAA
jgi:putative hydrolase of the HAD superfamily